MTIRLFIKYLLSLITYVTLCYSQGHRGKQNRQVAVLRESPCRKNHERVSDGSQRAVPGRKRGEEAVGGSPLGISLPFSFLTEPHLLSVVIPSNIPWTLGETTPIPTSQGGPDWPKDSSTSLTVTGSRRSIGLISGQVIPVGRREPLGKVSVL